MSREFVELLFASYSSLMTRIHKSGKPSRQKDTKAPAKRTAQNGGEKPTNSAYSSKGQDEGHHSSSADEDTYIAPNQPDRPHRQAELSFSFSKARREAFEANKGKPKPLASGLDRGADSSSDTFTKSPKVSSESPISKSSRKQNESKGHASPLTKNRPGTAAKTPSPLKESVSNERVDQNSHAPRGTNMVKGVATPPSSPEATGTAKFSELSRTPIKSATEPASVSRKGKNPGAASKQVSSIESPLAQKTKAVKLIGWPKKSLDIHRKKHAPEFKSEIATGRTYETMALQFFERPLTLGKGRQGIKEKINAVGEKIRFDYPTGVFGVLSAEQAGGVRNIITFFKPSFGKENQLIRACEYFEKQKYFKAADFH